MDLSSVSGTICHSILVFVPISGFVITQTAVLGVFFVQSNDTILNEALLEAHSFLFDVLVCLQTVHNHMMSKARVCIFYEHLDKMALRDGTRDPCCEDLPVL